MDISGFRRGEWCNCNATRVVQFIALRMSPADILIMDCSNCFGMNLKEGMDCMARNMIVLAIGLNLYQERVKRDYVMWVVAAWLRISSPKSPFTVSPSRYVDEYPKSSPAPTSDSVTMRTTGCRTRDESSNSLRDVWNWSLACETKDDEPIVLGRSWMRTIWFAPVSRDV